MFDCRGESEAQKLAFDTLFDTTIQLPSHEDTLILPMLTHLERSSRDGLLALFGVYMPAEGGGELRCLIRRKTPLSWAAIRDGRLTMQTPCLTWRTELQAPNQEWVWCTSTRSEDPIAGLHESAKVNANVSSFFHTVEVILNAFGCAHVQVSILHYGSRQMKCHRSSATSAECLHSTGA